MTRRLLPSVCVALLAASLSSAAAVKPNQAQCVGNGDPLNQCKTVSCVPSKHGGSFVRQVGSFIAPISAVSDDCLWILRPPNEQTIRKLQLKSADIAKGDQLLFRDGTDVIKVEADQSLDFINQQLRSFENRKLYALLVSFSGSPKSHFELDYDFA